MSVSLCMIVKNEEDCLPRCLNSVRDIVNEMIVVDTGSTDRTVEFAKSLGAKVYYYKWNDNFSDARNYSMSKANCDWILIMDADDELESEDKWKLLNITENRIVGANAYCGRTLCYFGDVPDNNSIITNMNIRLIRNYSGCKFAGSIHEQIVLGSADSGNPYGIVAANIRFRHYGYLSSVIAAKNKHNRNITLIEKELQVNPQNAFMLFNMGNEYYAKREYKTAMDYYMRSYQLFDPQPGYSPMLLIRIIMCHESLGTGNKIFPYVELGLHYYPHFTDFEFLRGNELLREKKMLQATRAYKKCLKMGEPSINMNSIVGVGTFKPHYALSTIYTAIGEYNQAIQHCKKALKLNRTFRDAYAEMVDLLKLQGIPANKIKTKLQRNLEKNEKSLFMLSDIFYDRGHFEQAYSLARAAEKLAPANPGVYYRQGVCQFHMKQYKNAYRNLLKSDSGAYRSKAGYLMLLCTYFDSSIAENKAVTGNLKIDTYYYQVVIAYQKLADGKTCAPLSNDIEISKNYITPIFDLLNILLRHARLEDFRKAIQLLNMVQNDEVLLKLAKMYYKNGFLEPACREFMRSIKLTNQIDAEGFDMMRNLEMLGYRASDVKL